MNQPAQTTGTVASQVIRSAACVLEFCTVQNTSSAARYYLLADNASAPPLTAAGGTPSGGILSSKIAAGATWTVFPVDLAKGAPFSRGCVLMSFAAKADGTQPDYTALSAADATLNAWSALLA